MNRRERMEAMDHGEGPRDGIAPLVLEVLARERFFEALDDRTCPADRARPRALCHGTSAISAALLADLGFDPDDIADAVRRSTGKPRQPESRHPGHALPAKRYNSL